MQTDESAHCTDASHPLLRESDTPQNETQKYRFCCFRNNCKKKEEATHGGSKKILYLMIIGVVLGFILGYLVSELNPGSKAMEVIGFPGEIFLNILKALVVPLMMAAIVTGVTSVDIRSTGSMGGITVILYGSTTILAAIFGIIWVQVIKPGDYFDANEQTKEEEYEEKSALDSILDILRSMFPPNLVQAAATNPPNILGIIVFSIVLAIVLARMPTDKAQPLIRFFDSLGEAISNIIWLVMWIAPLGVASLIISKLGADGAFWEHLQQLGLFVATAILGLLVHTFVFLPLMYLVFVRRNPFRFLRGLSQAMLMALGTASSAATLPMTMKCCEENNGIDERVSRFVLPLGSAINMNGTALYESVAAIFVAQTLDIQLSLGQIVIVALTATLAAVGAAGIPEAGLVTMVMVFSAVGIPLEGIGLLLSVDWLLDRLRTTCNVLGDAFCAGVVDHFEAHRRARQSAMEHAAATSHTLQQPLAEYEPLE